MGEKFGLVLDESIDSIVEEKLVSRNIAVYRPDYGATDPEVLRFSIEKGLPILTRDQGDFIQLGRELDNFGILIDKNLHERDRDLVADTVKGVLNEFEGELDNNTWFISNFYGTY